MDKTNISPIATVVIVLPTMNGAIGAAAYIVAAETGPNKNANACMDVDSPAKRPCPDAPTDRLRAVVNAGLTKLEANPLSINDPTKASSLFAVQVKTNDAIVSGTPMATKA